MGRRGKKRVRKKMKEEEKRGEAKERKRASNT
jgi:hypothetical protein